MLISTPWGCFLFCEKGGGCLNDDGVIKTIAALRVDITEAAKSLQQLQSEFTKVDESVKKTQTNMMNIGQPAATGAKGMTAAATATKQFNKEIEKQSVLASQWQRKLSWYWSGAIFYGAIRSMKEAVSQFSKVESSMVVIQRITNDATFSFEKMRKELMELGKEFGHTWDSVQQVAIRWTQAGYNIADTLELTRLSLLGLNVAEMDLEMATVGLISIMSQWDLQASDLELVIDKLNITSDRYAVTTGDLVAALQRTSGAARALGLGFEDTVGLITATRVASGRLGAEVGRVLPLWLVTTNSKSLKLRENLIETIRSQAA